MNNGVIYEVESDECKIEEFSKIVFGEVEATLTLSCFKLSKKPESGLNMVAINSQYVSSIEWYSSKQA